MSDDRAIMASILLLKPEKRLVVTLTDASLPLDGVAEGAGLTRRQQLHDLIDWALDAFEKNDIPTLAVERFVTYVTPAFTPSAKKVACEAQPGAVRGRR